MSANRRRRRRQRNRMVRHAGATGRKAERPQAERRADDKARVTRIDMIRFRQGQGEAQPHKPQRSSLWARHDIDMTPHIHGTRNATRNRSSAWGGHWLRMREWERGSFIRGKGLHRQELRWHYALYVQGKFVGYTDDAQYGLGWQRAAESNGLAAELRPIR